MLGHWLTKGVSERLYAILGSTLLLEFIFMAICFIHEDIQGTINSLIPQEALHNDTLCYVCHMDCVAMCLHGAILTRTDSKVECGVILSN